jgi:pSer/pThr/pTyr-binding forkhead associated (FHA) protein
MMDTRSSGLTGKSAINGLNTARLILAVGSQAGREAPLQFGYYMIGRHSECQIRPKSRSVSRRHCLLFQDETGLRVFDLDSAAGTRVNDLRIRAKTWTVLRHGDILRCGKVVFRIEFGRSEATRDAPRDERKQANSMNVGQAWHDVDIAGFLETQDHEDQERRYERIRTSNQQASLAAENLEDTQNSIELDEDLDLFDDAFDDPLPGQSAAAAQSDSGHPGQGRPTGMSKPSSEAADVKGSSGEQGRAGPKAKSAPSKRSGRSDPRRSRTKRFSSAGFPDANRLKTVGLTLVAILALGVLGYSAYSFYSGPDVRVLRNID